MMNSTFLDLNSKAEHRDQLKKMIEWHTPGLNMELKNAKILGDTNKIWRILKAGDYDEEIIKCYIWAYDCDDLTDHDFIVSMD